MPSFDGNLLTQRHEICSLETRDSTLSKGKNSESLSHQGLDQYRDVTDGQNDACCLAQCIVSVAGLRVVQVD